MKKIFVFPVLIFMLQLSAIDSVRANDDGTYCTGCQGYVEETYTGDECGGQECTATTNPSGIPHPPGSHYAGSPRACSQGETGITIHHFTQNCPNCPCCTPDCSCASSTYVGSNCSDGCGGSCSGIRRDGVCGTRAKVYEATDLALSGTWCTYGSETFPNGAPVLPAPGGTSVNWTCSGVSGGNAITTCHASRKLPAPIVDFKINGSDGPVVNVNKDNGDDLDFSWNVAKNTAVPGVTTYCDKNGLTWGTGQIIPTKNLVDSDNNFPLPGAPYPKTNIPYSLTCQNRNGNATFNSLTHAETIGATVVCTPADVWSGCPKECGLPTETESCTRTNANCTTNSCGIRNCNYDPCPVTSEWKEVK